MISLRCKFAWIKRMMENLVTFMDSDVSNLEAMNNKNSLLNVKKIHGKQSLCKVRGLSGSRL